MVNVVGLCQIGPPKLYVKSRDAVKITTPYLGYGGEAARPPPPKSVKQEPPEQRENAAAAPVARDTIWQPGNSLLICTTIVEQG